MCRAIRNQCEKDEMTGMKISVNALQKMAAEGQKISMLTCYDASFASLLEEAGVDILLIGDSLGMVIQNQDSTLPVSLDDMVYHTRCVARGAKNAMVLADLSFGSYQESPQQAFASAARLMQAGAHMVKIEGGAFMAETTRFLVERGIPVCSHIGLTPQFVNTFGGYRVQGKGDAAAEQLLQDARGLAEAGASLVLMECVPAELAGRVTRSLAVPTIGIGAGPQVSGQVLVMHDMLGVYPGKKARFVKNFMVEAHSIQDAVAAYVRAVKDGSFPAPEHCF
jgi:3-methyl-2-oxobutanoate hydroxymethyltransferase